MRNIYTSNYKSENQNYIHTTTLLSSNFLIEHPEETINNMNKKMKWVEDYPDEYENVLQQNVAPKNN